MADLYVNTWNQEDTVTESDSSSLPDDNETLLYSLVYHSKPSDEDFVIPDLNTVSSGNSFTISQRTKASRWNRVKHIMESANAANVTSVPSYTSEEVKRYSEGNSSSVVERPDQSLERNVSRENVFKNAALDFHPLESSVSCDQRFNSNGKNNSSQHSFEMIDGVSTPNLRAVLESLSTAVGPRRSKRRKKDDNKNSARKLNFSETVHTVKNNSDLTRDTIKRVVTENYVNKSTKCDPLNNNQHMTAEHNNNASEMEITDCNNRRRKDVNENHSGNDKDDVPSKYNVISSQKKAPNSSQSVQQNCDPEPDVIDLFTDSDLGSDSEVSVVELAAPPRAPPPIVVLDSSDENEKASSSTLNMASIKTSNLIVHCSVNGQNVSQVTVVAASGSRESGQHKEKKKKGKKKKKDPNKQKTNGIDSSPEVIALPRDDLTSDCHNWTPDMVRFYNHPWGDGRKFELDQVRKNMSGHFRHWKILDADRYGPLKISGPNARTRCRNCNQRGHLSHRCPDPPKQYICYMCGERGHQEPRCPKKICLKCGRPSALYTVGCTLCSAPGADAHCCVSCGQMGHYVYQCPSAWRRFHLTTSTHQMKNACPALSYKPPHQQYCCNCAKRGHHLSECRNQPAQLSHGMGHIHEQPRVPPRSNNMMLFDQHSQIKNSPMYINNSVALTRDTLQKCRQARKKRRANGGRKMKRKGHQIQNGTNYV